MREIQTPTQQNVITRDRLRPKVIRKRTQRCLTFNPDVFEPFQEMCVRRDTCPSRVIERFMNNQIRAI